MDSKVVKPAVAGDNAPLRPGVQNHELASVDAEVKLPSDAVEHAQTDDVVPETERPPAVGYLEMHRAERQGVGPDCRFRKVMSIGVHL